MIFLIESLTAVSSRLRCRGRATQRKTRLFVLGRIEQRGERGVDARVLRIARIFGHWLQADLRGGVMIEKVLLDRAHAFQLLRILSFFQEIVRGFRCGGAPFLDDFRIALHADARAEDFEIQTRETFAVQFAQAALEIMEVGRSE